VKRTFVALTTTVRLVADDELGIDDLAAFLIDAYPATAAAPDIAYRLRAGVMEAVDRYDDPVADTSDLVPLFELDLYQQVGERAAAGWLLHAAALERDGRAFVFAGPSGAGKTSLTLALLARGWRLLTEEIALVDRELFVRGLARPIHLPSEREVPAGWRHRPYPIRGGASTIVAHPPPGARTSGPLPVGAIVRISHAPGAAATLDPLPPTHAIHRLWDATLRTNDDGLAAAVDIAARARLFELCTSSVAASVELVERYITRRNS
jgi:hypothetical protein